MRTCSIYALALLSATVGCTSAATAPAVDTPAIRVVMSKPTYIAGEPFVAIFTNTSAENLQYGNPDCNVALEVRSGRDSAWTTARPASGQCTLELRLLAPGRSDSTVFRSDASLPAGQYRLTVPSPAPPTGPAAPERLASPAFLVAPGIGFGDRQPRPGAPTT